MSQGNQSNDGKDADDKDDKQGQKKSEEEFNKSKNLPKPPSNRKSILRRNTDSLTTDKKPSGAYGRKFRFDEENIKETYHPEGKDYGHMVIDEPPTPKVKKSDAVDPVVLNEKLEELERKQKEEAEAEERRRLFEEKRKKHYMEEFHMKNQNDKEKKDEK